jgi:hypothetical protein
VEDEGLPHEDLYPSWSILKETFGDPRTSWTLPDLVSLVGWRRDRRRGQPGWRRLGRNGVRETLRMTRIVEDSVRMVSFWEGFPVQGRLGLGRHQA